MRIPVTVEKKLGDKLDEAVPYVEVANRVIINENPASIYLLKVNNRNTRTRCEICSKLTIKTPQRRFPESLF